MMRPRGEQPVYEPTENKGNQQPAMRFFPLETDGMNENARARAVNPLAHRKNPINMLGQSMLGQKPPRQNDIQQNKMPPPTEMNLPPERAAEQFTRINKGLPDGVHYEPLDEQTLRLLRENGHLPALPPPPPPPQNKTQASPPQVPSIPVQPMPPQPVPAPPASQPEAKKIIEGLLQNRRNALIFYNHRATTDIGNEAKDIFSNLSRECKAQMEQYDSILARYFNHSFTPHESAIDTSADYKKAVALALAEENKMIHTLSNLLYILQDTEAERSFQRIINKKIAGYNQLLTLM
jgi:rubrerythrin